MEMIIWGSAVSGVFVLCKLLKPTFKKFFSKDKLGIVYI